MNVVYYERGLLWTWSVMNVVCYERGLLWTWSVMNLVCYELNVICYELVCYERGLLLMGLLWTGLLWTWSVLNGLFWAVCYEQVCFERSPVEKPWLAVFIVTCALSLGVVLDFFQLQVHSAILCLCMLPTEPSPGGLQLGDFTFVQGELTL